MIFLHYNAETGEILNAADESCFQSGTRKPEEPYITVEPEIWRDAMKRRKIRRIVDGKLAISAKIVTADYDVAMEEYIKSVRVARGYTLREPDCYINSRNARRASDAADFIDFRDAVLDYGAAVLEEYEKTGFGPSLDEFKANFPKISWSAK